MFNYNDHIYNDMYKDNIYTVEEVINNWKNI